MRLTLLRLVIIAAVFSTTGCSDYDRRWRAGQSAPTVSAAKARDVFAGSYSGTWASNRYAGAKGKLRCILTRQTPDLYRADFQATWHGIFTSHHTVMLRITGRERVSGVPNATFEGATQIRMWIGSGRYHCTGRLTPTGFVAEYDAESDRGRFDLARVLPSPGQN